MFLRTVPGGISFHAVQKHCIEISVDKHRATRQTPYGEQKANIP
jgi:hypothetical protein